MLKIRTVVAYRNYFEDFLLAQPEKVQNKIFKIIEAIETLERVPENYLKSLKGTQGLYEARIQLGTDIWRVFCFFDEHNLVILLTGFQKKTRKTPVHELKKALRLMKEYFYEKHQKNANKKMGQN
jgi:phage-related protein